jgi:hypothetical protein
MLPKGAFAQSMRLAGALGVTAGFLRFYLGSSCMPIPDIYSLLQTSPKKTDIP